MRTKKLNESRNVPLVKLGKKDALERKGKKAGKNERMSKLKNSIVLRYRAYEQYCFINQLKAGNKYS